jgi:hypothetical protein
MPLILAESAPHRGRAIAFAAILALLTFLVFLAAVPSHHHRRFAHRRLPAIGKCVYTPAGYVYVYVTR